MGARLYNPTTGQFLSTDPVLGGNATPYGYPTDPVNSADLNGQWGYTYRFRLDRTWRSASSYFSRVRSIFTQVFPFSGARSLATGRKMYLRPFNLYFPVYVKRITSTGWTFGVLRGHPDYPGSTINFYFYKKDGYMKLRVRAYITWYSPGGQCPYSPACMAAYLGGTYKSWSTFASNLRARL